MLSRRTFVAAGGAAAAWRHSASRASRSPEQRPTAASSSSFSAGRPTACTSSPRPATLPMPACAATSRRTWCTGAKLDAFFTLHPALAETAKMYAAQGRRCSSTPLPRPIATARTSTGRTCSRPADRLPTGCSDGWMNRLLGLLPATKPRRWHCRRRCRWRFADPMRCRHTRLRNCRARSDDLLARVSALYAARPAASCACGARRWTRG